MQVTILFNDLPKILANLEPEAGRIVADAAKRIRDDAHRRIVDPPKSGHVYTSGPQPLPHQASAPGESPATWTGDLAASLDAHPLGPTSAEATAGTDHAKAMEFGSPDGKVAARPFMLPSSEEERPKFEAEMAQVVEAARNA